MYGFFSEEPAPVRFNSASTKLKNSLLNLLQRGPPLWRALRLRQLVIEHKQSGVEEVTASTTP